VKVSISGIRGVYTDDDLSLYEVAKFSRLFARSLAKPEQKCVLGRDTRPSSMAIAKIAAASLMQEGVEVYDLNVAPTPMVFHESRKYRAGCIVTASHNPLEWNGLKFILEGRGIFENELHIMLNGMPSIEKKLTRVYGKSFQTVSNYINEIVQLLKQSQNSTHSNNHVKVGLDPGGGAACGYINKLFKNLGYKFHSINDVYGMSSRGTDPTVDDLNDLIHLVVANELNFGFALDLDGDRLVVVDEHGKKLAPDTTLLLCMASALSLGMKKFVTSIDTSVTIEKFAKSHGSASVKFDFSKVGESNVVSKMLKEDADAGGEGSSAGFILPKFNMCRDGFLASAIISSLNTKTIDECMKLSGQYSQIRTKMPLPSHMHGEVIEKLSDILKRESSNIITIDGIKAIIDDDSWVLVRASNTEHAIRVSVESKVSLVRTLYNRIINKVQSVYETVK
jgi:phosphomannomutase